MAAWATRDLGRLDSWFESLGLSYGDHVFVDRGTSVGREDVARWRPPTACF